VMSISTTQRRDDWPRSVGVFWTTLQAFVEWEKLRISNKEQARRGEHTLGDSHPTLRELSSERDIA
jgi:heme-degrading monooxygenase HmoA